MSFRNINLLNSYKTYKNDIVREFYTPVLSESVLYQRAVGFFSSGALIDLTIGLKGLIKNHGRIQFIVSPVLMPEDIAAIEKGYESKKIIEDALIRDFKEPENYFEEERLNFLAYMIEEGFLDIKVAFTPPYKSYGMYHEKVGILKDLEGNTIVFIGSLNETINAFHNNYESIVVFNSWEESKKYVDEIENDFNELWMSKDIDLEVIDFPDVLKERFKIYRKIEYDKYIFSEDNIDKDAIYSKKPVLDSAKVGVPHIPEGFILREYQTQAISQWFNRECVGIFDMATGTGKTYTGLAAAAKLFERQKRLAIIIVCPFQHLVEQWVEDIELFNMRPIIGYSASRQRNWKNRLQNDVIDFNVGIIDSFCFVTTNATFASEYVTRVLKKLKNDSLIIVDEAHNFGAFTLREKLNQNIEYRIALSATLDRHRDEDGTACLKNYFGEKCIEYNLERAIKENKLTPYYYYPIVVYLDEDEFDNYKELSYLIAKECHVDKKGKLIITERGKSFLLKRSRVIAGARQKLSKLREIMNQYKNDNHILVYCGATRMNDYTNDSTERDDMGERQIVAVSTMLGQELNMKVRHFTSNESAEEREKIKRQFALASPYQALVAIKCLDEGVNIPSIRTAFILASTTNPKEYIQRRGRVLRLAKDKPYAVIYDFVTFSRNFDEISQYNPEFNCERALAARELNRIKEFGNISINKRDTFSLIEKIENTYHITKKESEENTDVDDFK